MDVERINGDWRGVRVLVTGGAGLVGSHIADLLVAKGARVTILDSLDPQTHADGPPPWLPAAAGFIRGDIRDRADVRRAAEGAEVVFHEAACGGAAPDGEACRAVNVEGTRRLFEALAVGGRCRTAVVASSQAVYGEGPCSCPVHGEYRTRGPRVLADLAARRFDRPCPLCGGIGTPVPIPEDAETAGWTPYATAKLEAERVALAAGREAGIGTVVLRYAVTYGPRQSVFNPLTGIVSIFSTRLLNGRPPVVYEDGLQTRDFVHVADVARANLLIARHPEAAGKVFNVGSGEAATILDIVRLLNGAFGTAIAPEIRSFRPGDSRHIVLDASRIAALGFSPRVPLREGLASVAAWCRGLGKVADRFAEAEPALRATGAVLDG